MRDPDPTGPQPNLYLVGFMGTGKTTIGRAVAYRLRYQLFDSDHEIENAQARPISEIFATDGEAAFRQMERKFIETGHPAGQSVVACGGGLVVQPGMLDLLKSKGVVVCLHASWETILRRTSTNKNRPLLDVEDPMARIQTLYKEREPIYKRADVVILTDHRPTSDIISHVMRVYRREARDWAHAHGA
ncbi:shikimate kinase [Synoicihabitans lomoniglobus]|uniref:Shikimate kinase n=1 Tax=Synoicihabitans lomoniglobus TaxID=2909285 RepID=A0AAF0CSW2_9BACT|nr:shikimate kinase [Opitutaceae bacterium LMO-M01]WED67428.1 shikimate kinase [Opitutaceae bacterium LMO-M01]